MSGIGHGGQVKQEDGIIVIGASKGGIRAVGTILAGIPLRFLLPVVVVLHRMPMDNDRLVMILQSDSALSVSEPEDKDPIEAGRVYVAPADYHLLMEDGRFTLSVDEPVSYSRPSIDVLFTAAADAFGKGVTAILLTGANQDGEQGMVRVKQNGGRTIVQKPDTAEAPEMPQSAIDAGAADRVLSLQEIVEFLAALASSSDVKTLPRKV